MRRGPGPRIILAAVLGVGLAPGLAGCLDDETLGLVVSSPKQAGGLTVAVMKDGSIGDGPSGKARYDILYQGKRVYPIAPFGGTFQVDAGRGATFVPYHLFVVGNGEYEVRVRFDDAESSMKTRVEKWAEYVYLHPYLRGQTVFVDLQLSKAQGGAPTDRIVAEGDLRLDVRYRGLDGKSNEYVMSVRAKTPPDETYTKVEVAKSRFTKPGYYSFDAVWHNSQAKGNTWVGNDPSLASRSPPWNWVFVN